MFGMGMGELLVVAIIAIIFLGPEKLPDAMVKGARYFKAFKRSINDVKSTIEQEMQIQDLKDEALAYKKKLDEAANSVKKTISFDELEDIKKSTQGVSDSLKELETSINSSISLDDQAPQATNETQITNDTQAKKEEPKKEEIKNV